MPAIMPIKLMASASPLEVSFSRRVELACMMFWKSIRSTSTSFSCMNFPQLDSRYLITHLRVPSSSCSICTSLPS